MHFRIPADLHDIGGHDALLEAQAVEAQRSGPRRKALTDLRAHRQRDLIDAQGRISRLSVDVDEAHAAVMRLKSALREAKRTRRRKMNGVDTAIKAEGNCRRSVALLDKKLHSFSGDAAGVDLRKAIDKADPAVFQQALQFVDRTQPITWVPKHKLSWRTVPIDVIFSQQQAVQVNLGAFDVTVEVTYERDYGGTESTVTCTPVTPNYGSGVQIGARKSHPHISETRPCLGDVAPPLHKMVKGWKPFAAIVLMHRYLSSYNRADPYVVLLNWALNEDDVNKCSCGRGEPHFELECPWPNCKICSGPIKSGLGMHPQCEVLLTKRLDTNELLPRHVLAFKGVRDVPSYLIARQLAEQLQ